MLVFLIVYFLAALVGIGALVVFIGKAPEGYENKNGFRFGTNEPLDSSQEHPIFHTRKSALENRIDHKVSKDDLQETRLATGRYVQGSLVSNPALDSN